MGIPFTMGMGFLFTATMGNLFTMTLGIELTVSRCSLRRPRRSSVPSSERAWRPTGPDVSSFWMFAFRIR